MSTTETIILTSIVNIIITGLIGGIVVYTVQKKIDATIQKSLFEYQTKFTQIYAKRVEALEGLYQKYISFAEALDKVILDMIDAQDGGRVISQQEADKNKEYLSGKLNDFGSYFKANRLFLPEGLIDQIWDISQKSEIAQSIIAIQSAHFEQVNNVPDYWWITTREFLGVTGISNHPNSFLAVISNLISDQTKELEHLYKSVAETEP